MGADSSYYLTALMLFLPLLDNNQRQLLLNINKRQIILWSFILIMIGLLVIISATKLLVVISIICLTALPEEWFFRRYLQTGLNSYFKKTSTLKLIPSSVLAIVSSSVIFTTLHIPSQGYLGLLVFIPSLFFGYIYQLKQDLIFVILLHSLFNLFFLVFIKDMYLVWFQI